MVFGARTAARHRPPAAAGQRLRAGGAAAPRSARRPPQSLTLAGMHFAYLLPEGRGVRGVFLFLHSCGRHSLDWFHLGGAADGLAIGGLVEETSMAEAVLDLGFAAVAPDAYPTYGACWNPGVDTVPLESGLLQLIKGLGLPRAPLYGVGASSGGVQLSVLVARETVHFHGLVFNVSPGASTAKDPGLFARPLESYPEGRWPPTFFVHMPLDDYAPPAVVATATEALARAGGAVRSLAVGPRPLTELSSVAKEMGMTPEAAMYLISSLSSWGLVEIREKQPFLIYNGAEVAQQKLLMQAMQTGSVQALRQMRQVTTELTVFEGIHAPTSASFKAQVLPFLLHPRPPQPGDVPADG